ncbi:MULTISPECIES: inositol monophosphatase family protein [Methylomonas]|uniref:Inositol-1-monophosphatase n=1 Tax=Methylomonas koyamae TaxID=702114 RepID=A0A291IME9_9GAMM|nr:MULTISPECIES: inositol monophosphatase family protein [Methylomonas]ANE56476.1 inositol monophosphatase [Methylomonas sp. DH-1]ATG91434.1 inositol monophosphatase [Methylomonas koyamae]OAI26826.1 inositol monophosphatase [Methylomonas koyamae]WNB77029.1 inositol monophosphatase family protein [Methylomonas koyamae]BBL57442.1 inositol monophosphatase [Methylomonas koyamae]
MHPMLNIAVRAARNAGDLIQRSSLNIEKLTIDQKSRNDYASEVDRAAEQEIIKVIRTAFPDHGILAEESGETKGNDYTWIIDPLDGTTNFLHGFPHYAVSIALKNKNKLEIGVIYDPTRDELFTAERGGGAMLNNRRIRVTKQNTMRGALIGTGFPFKTMENIEPYLGMFKAVCADAAGIRRAGAAALDMAYVACGRLDAYWEIGVKEWDIAAGVLLVQEAGGVATDFSFNDKYLQSGNIITGNPKMHQLMYQIIEPHVPARLK